MPLKAGSSPGTIQANIKELMDKFTATGGIGTSRPESTPAAQKQAAAIAYSKAGQAEGKRSKAKRPVFDADERGSMPRKPG